MSVSFCDLRSSNYFYECKLNKKLKLYVLISA